MNTEDVAGVLAAHERVVYRNSDDGYGWSCFECEERIADDVSVERAIDLHRAHVAAQLAPLIAQARVEGYDAACEHDIADCRTPGRCEHNPYREGGEQ